MTSVKVCRTLQLPDPLRLERYRKNPELGPRILFFSGGSAINPLCRSIKQYTHNSIHLITAFDSGGSSATLRSAFNMPAVGDIRSRLLALADESVLSHQHVIELLNKRLPVDAEQNTLRDSLLALTAAKTNNEDLPNNPMTTLVLQQLRYFLKIMPKDFDLRGACIGNLVLAGGYLNNDSSLEPIIFLFSKLAKVLGEVHPVIDKDLHVCAQLADGSQIIGQHYLTGKEVSPLRSPISRITLSGDPHRQTPVHTQISDFTRRFIDLADLIVYAPGSFYTSLIASLLPTGIGAAIAQNDCPKIWIPNLGQDPEQIGTTFSQRLKVLLTTLQQDLNQPVAKDRLLNFVLADNADTNDPGLESQACFSSAPFKLIKMPLISEASAPYYDSEMLARILLSMT